jgi:6-phosphogluconolactonase (cycloisomerase 2 family)
MNPSFALRFPLGSMSGLRSLAAVLLFGLTGVMAGCGGSSVAVTGSSTVPLATLVSIGVTPAAPSIAQGTQQQFTATGVYSDNSKIDLTATVGWTSSTPTVATISNAATTVGLASGVGAGSTTITATQGGISGTTTLTVTGKTLASITVTPANPSIAKGLTQTFTATGTYADNSTQDLTSMVAWTSSNPSIASISSSGATAGTATAVAAGSATITATLSGVSGTTTLTVTAAALVSIAVTPPTPSIANGTTQQFVATGTYTDGTTLPITATAAWTSSAVGVASISNAAGQQGLAKGLSLGSTTITATLNGVSGSTLLTVTPAILLSIVVTPANPVILNSVTAQHNTTQLTATGTYSDLSTQVITTTVVWTSATPAVATISNAAGSSGLATAGLTLATTQVTAQATNAVGTIITSPAITLTVKASEFAYVANFNEGTVSQYTVGTGGALTPNAAGATVTAGTQPYSIAVDPTGHYVYAANYNGSVSGSVSQYTIGADGSLTPNGAGATVATNGFGPNGITVDPSGTHVYVANYGDSANGTGASVAQFTLGAGGALTPMTPSNVAAANGAASVALNLASTYAYVPNYIADSIAVYSIAGGALTLASTTNVTAGSAPSFALVDPSGPYLYVTEQADKGTPGVAGGIAQFTIGANGALTPMSTPVISVSGNPRSLTLDPTGTYVYLANGTDSILQLSIGAGGALSLVSTTTVGPNSAPNFLTVDATGQYAYVGDRGTATIPGSTVSQYTIGAASALVPTAPATVASGTTPNSRPAGIVTTKAY